jgi:hypothetical protein
MTAWVAMRAVLKLQAQPLLVTSLLVALAGCGGGSSSGNNSKTPILNYQSVITGDLNHDDKLDIAACVTSTSVGPIIENYVAVYLQDAANPGTFQPPAHYTVAGTCEAIAMGDLNSDGQPDLVAANLNMDNVSVLLQDGTGSGHFLRAANYPAGTGPCALAIGDLNGDGKPDIAVAGYDVAILFQNPNSPGTFMAPTTLYIPWGAPNSVATADLNGDGNADLVAPTVGNVAVFLQDPAMPGNFFSAVGYSAGVQPWGVVVGDLNADGRPDIAVANFGPPNQQSDASVSILLQNPSAPGTFLAPANYATARLSTAVQIADLDGDGHPDLAVANDGALLTTCPPNCIMLGSGVSVLLQDPANSGAFLPATNYAPFDSTESVRSVAIGDMNGDGKPDLVLAYYDKIVIRFQDPNAPGKFLGETVVTK